MSEAKNVIIMVRAGESSKEECLKLRDKVLSLAKTFNDVSIVDEPPLPIALINCTEEVKQVLKKQFPQVVIEDEISWQPESVRPGL